jgi:hypothetical protein
MKKARLIFATSACLLAGAAVYANTLFVTTFYRSSTTISTSNPSSADPSCEVQITTTACPAVTGLICTIPAGTPGAWYVVSKTVDNPNCVLARKTN